MQLIDAHLHLADESFQEDIEEILLRANQGSIGALLNVSTTKEELERSLQYAAKEETLCFLHAAGTPPHDIFSEHLERDYTFFAEAASQGRLAAIGEIGLDYGFIKNDKEKVLQHNVFKRYLALAEQYNLPPVIHCRNAFNDFFSIIDTDYQGKPGMLHCFTGSLQEVQALVERDWYISISGIVTFKNAENLREVLQAIPLDKLLIETDAPFLAPVPVRGKKNEPAFIRYTFERIAELKGLDVVELAAIVYKNMFDMLSL